jgi:hypothetical protein
MNNPFLHAVASIHPSYLTDVYLRKKLAEDPVATPAAALAGSGNGGELAEPSNSNGNSGSTGGGGFLQTDYLDRAEAADESFGFGDENFSSS